MIDVAAFLTPLQLTADERRPRSMLVLDQSDVRLKVRDRSTITLCAESILSPPLAST